MISAKNVAIKSRATTTLRVMRTTPPMISPATPKIKAPAQRIAPKRAVSNAVAILRNACPMYRIAFISFSLLTFFVYADLRAEGVEFHLYFRLSLSDIFLCVFRSLRSFSFQLPIHGRSRGNKVF